LKDFGALMYLKDIVVAVLNFGHGIFGEIVMRFTGVLHHNVVRLIV